MLGAAVVGRPRRRFKFSLLKEGRDIPEELPEEDEEEEDAVEGAEVVDSAFLEPDPRNLPRLEVAAGFSAFTVPELSFCTSSSTACFCPGLGLLKPPPLLPKRPRVLCVDSAGASVLVVLPPLVLNRFLDPTPPPTPGRLNFPLPAGAWVVVVDGSVVVVVVVVVGSVVVVVVVSSVVVVIMISVVVGISVIISLSEIVVPSESTSLLDASTKLF